MDENVKKPKKKKGLIIAIAVVIVVIIAAAAGSSGSKSDSSSTSAAKEADNGSTGSVNSKDGKSSTYGIGETATSNGVKITLTDVSESIGSQFLKPSDGNVYVACEFTIENESKKDITVSSAMSFEAYCDDMSINQSISALTALKESGKNQLDGSVAVGKKMNGIICYEVPEDWQTMEVNFSSSFFGTGSVKFVANK